MKAAAFDYETPASLDEAVRLLAQSDGAAKIIAGGQSLGPMLNLRLAQPVLLIAVRKIGELRAVAESADAVALGAGITHAEIEDGKVPDPTRGLLPFVARRIAYRAVRNRGTIGGSLAHADPAADWVSALALAGATLTVQGPRGARMIAADKLLLGAFETQIAADEILVRVSIPRFSAQARWSYYKICRKTGEFADAIGGVLIDPARGVRRTVVGATAGAPIVIDGDTAWRGATAMADGHKKHLLDVALRRAQEKVAV